MSAGSVHTGYSRGREGSVQCRQRSVLSLQRVLWPIQPRAGIVQRAANTRLARRYVPRGGIPQANWEGGGIPPLAMDPREGIKGEGGR